LRLRGDRYQIHQVRSFSGLSRVPEALARRSRSLQAPASADTPRHAQCRRLFCEFGLRVGEGEEAWTRRKLMVAAFVGGWVERLRETHHLSARSFDGFREELNPSYNHPARRGPS